jgi:amino-acid N-acetyltransferase
MSILRAKPSLRDSKNYLTSFGAKPKLGAMPTEPVPQPAVPSIQVPAITPALSSQLDKQERTGEVLESILDPVIRRTALVKLQGPFTDRQLSSIAQGMAYLEKLGLVSVIVLENDEWDTRDSNIRALANETAMNVAAELERQGSRARPIFDAVVRLGPQPDEMNRDDVLEAHTTPEDMIPMRRSLQAGEIPVITPFAVDSHSRCIRTPANHVIAALVRGMVGVDKINVSQQGRGPSGPNSFYGSIDLTPHRLMIINREGGIPSYARAGLPHLLVNLDSEYNFIRDSFHRQWWKTNPTALTNLNLARTCLNYMPPAASAIMVSHRSKSSLIANLITNKPAFSSSLPHALLKEGNLSPDTPTLLRRGLPIQVIKRFGDIDQQKLTDLLEKSFNRKLDAKSFYSRLTKRLDYVIVAGDYAGAAVVTQEPEPGARKEDGSPSTVTYLDKFAVLPNHQGDGTVDFLWVALHDESYGLGHPYSVNPNGGNEGMGVGRDLVWRSRANNPINKWYFERCSGHVRDGDWITFWCDAEMRLKDALTEKANANGRIRAKLSYVEGGEEGRGKRWQDTLAAIPSVWSEHNIIAPQ